MSYTESDINSMFDAKDKNIDLKIEEKESFGAIALYQKHKILDANYSFANIFGYKKEEINGVYISNLFTLESYILAIKNCILGNETTYDLDCRKKDGSLFKCRISSKLETKNGKTVGTITARLPETQKTDSHFSKKLDRYSALFENTQDGIYICDTGGVFIDVNPAFLNMLGYIKREELISKKIPHTLYTNLHNNFNNNFIANHIFETILTRKDGSSLNVEVSTCMIFEKTELNYILGIVRDITQRKQTEEKIRILSFYDSLTGLYNRAFFEEELIRLNNERNLPLSLVIGDVSGLKLINDTFGHYEGDMLLKKCAEVFKACCRKDDIIARWGGDEFSILLPNTNEDEVEDIIKRIKGCCNQDLNTKIDLNIALGNSCKYFAYQDIHAVMKEAEDSMYTNKLTDSKIVSNSIFLSLKRMLYEKSIETEAHAERLKDLAVKIGQAIKLPKRKIEELILLATLHDIGKVSISENILNKKGKLTEEEWKLVKKHPLIGYRIVLSCSQLSPISKGILYHHEHWDGTGYPEGIFGEDIPITSRIISIIDAFDVMIMGRPYKKAMSANAAINELKRCTGKQFDPELVKLFLNIVKG